MLHQRGLAVRLIFSYVAYYAIGQGRDGQRRAAFSHRRIMRRSDVCITESIKNITSQKQGKKPQAIIRHISVRLYTKRIFDGLFLPKRRSVSKVPRESQAY